jgi:hypothetical protein
MTGRQRYRAWSILLLDSQKERNNVANFEGKRGHFQPGGEVVAVEPLAHGVAPAGGGGCSDAGACCAALRARFRSRSRLCSARRRAATPAGVCGGVNEIIEGDRVRWLASQQGNPDGPSQRKR